MTTLEANAIEMKKAIRMHATSFSPTAHPLLHIIDAIKALFTIKQGDEVDVETYSKRLTSAKKVMVERLGATIAPVSYAKTLANHNPSNPKDAEKQAWEELVAMLGVLGANDTKYKSWKEELKNDHSKGYQNYPKSITELKQQLTTRKWDATPTKKNPPSSSNQAPKDEAK